MREDPSDLRAYPADAAWRPETSGREARSTASVVAPGLGLAERRREPLRERRPTRTEGDRPCHRLSLGALRRLEEARGETARGFRSTFHLRATKRGGARDPRRTDRRPALRHAHRGDERRASLRLRRRELDRTRLRCARPAPSTPTYATRYDLEPDDGSVVGGVRILLLALDGRGDLVVAWLGGNDAPIPMGGETSPL